MNPKKSVPAMIRQGDLLLVRVANPPADSERKPTKDGTCTIGYGEVTGHHHTIQDAVWYVAPEVTMEELHQFALGNKTIPVFVVADEPTTLTHQEHAPLAIEAGVWQVLRQREYSSAAIVSVRD